MVALPWRLPIPDWDRAPVFGRRGTLMSTLRRLQEVHPGPVCVVETGTLRSDGPNAVDGDGWSTMAWGWYCSQVGGRVYTVDIEPINMNVCRRITEPYSPWIEYVVSDSVTFLGGWPSGSARLVDLVYLDSMDYEDRGASEAHCLAEAQAVLPHLAPVALILIDDTPYDQDQRHGCVEGQSGKGILAIPFLRGHGFRVEFAIENQTLLARA